MTRELKRLWEQEVISCEHVINQHRRAHVYVGAYSNRTPSLSITSAFTLTAMIPSSPSSSPARPAFINLTNEEPSLLTASDRKRPSEGCWNGGDQKRVKLQDNDKEGVVLEVSHDSDSDDEPPQPYAQTLQRPYNVYGIRNAAMRNGPSSLSRLPCSASSRARPRSSAEALAN